MTAPIVATDCLAIDGGSPVRQRPFAPWPSFAQSEIDAVTAVLRSGRVNYWTGNEGRSFEREFADFVSCKYAVALANGTVGLELALRAIGVGDGDEVIVTSRSFVASASAIVMCGARPVFADVNSQHQNITRETVEAVLSPRTRAIIAVHLAGWPCDMDPLMALAKERGLRIIEDCAQAHGAQYRGRPVGSLGDVAVFSFCQDKIITTGGEGGMLTTSDTEVWERAWAFKDHGKSYDAVYNRKHAPGFRWLHETFGTNWRMTEMQSAIGRVVLKTLPDWVDRRRQHAQMLNEMLSALPAVRITIPPDDIKHAYYKYYCFVQPSRLKPGWDRDRIMNAITAEGIPCYSGSCSEMYLEKCFETKQLQPEQSLEVARELGETSLMFLVHPTLDEGDMCDVGRAIEKVMGEAS